MLISLPEEGVSETPVTVIEKARIDVFGGGTSGFAASVKLTVAFSGVQLDVQPLPFGTPLQELSTNATAKREDRRKRGLRFIRHPTLDRK